MISIQNKRLRFSAVISLITLSLLLFVRTKLRSDFLLFDRLFENGGLWQIAIITLFSACIAYKFYDRDDRAKWRQRVWLFFGIIFFMQLLLGIVVDSLFLMSGKLHLPIPSVILTGSIYRMDIGFMPILFFVTVLLSGGAWCSYLCYFGAFDSVASGGGKHTSYPRLKYRVYVLTVFVLIAVVLRVANTSMEIATWFGVSSGILGLLIIIFISRTKKTMSHCSFFCPLGTVVSYLKFVSPFRYRISDRCTQCLGCTTSCKSGALSKGNIYRSKPSIGCTMCGDCAVKCKHKAFEYRFLRFSPRVSELIFVGTVVVIYSLFLIFARV